MPQYRITWNDETGRARLDQLAADSEDAAVAKLRRLAPAFDAAAYGPGPAYYEVSRVAVPRKRDAECECVDPGCDCAGQCHATASATLFRVDMADYNGMRFCERCAEDAMASGVFSTVEDNDGAPEDEQLDEQDPSADAEARHAAYLRIHAARSGYLYAAGRSSHGQMEYLEELQRLVAAWLNDLNAAVAEQTQHVERAERAEQE